MTILVVIGAICLGIGVLLLVIVLVQEKQLGTVSKKRLYTDTTSHKGEVLYGSSLLLVGKPDYIIKHNNTIIPVEVKMGKTPQTPYRNHITQAIAYCILVEENYGSRPQYAIIKYPEREFEVIFSDEYETFVRRLIADISEYKENKKIMQYTPHLSFLCYSCRSIRA